MKNGSKEHERQVVAGFTKAAEEVFAHYGVRPQKCRVVEALVALTGKRVGGRPSPTNSSRTNPIYEIVEGGGAARDTMGRMVTDALTG